MNIILKVKHINSIVIVCFLLFISGCSQELKGFKYENMVIVPDRAFFGSKKIDGIDPLFKGNLDGKNITINFGFNAKKDSRDVAILLEVEKGAIKFITTNGYMMFLPNNKIAIKDTSINDSELLFTLTVENPYLMIYCGKVFDGKNKKEKVVAICRVPSVIETDGVDFVIQKLKVIENGNLRIVPLKIEFSGDFKGRVLKIVVPMTM